MGYLKVLIFILILTSLVSFFYKIYLQLLIKNPEGKISFLSIFIRFYNLADLLPMSTKSNDTRERTLRKKANIALATFYLSFILVQVIAAMIAHNS